MRPSFQVERPQKIERSPGGQPFQRKTQPDEILLYCPAKGKTTIRKIASTSRSSAERILHGDCAVLLPVLQILCVQHIGASGPRGGDNLSISERDLITLLIRRTIAC